jgi:hypothetical protein
MASVAELYEQVRRETADVRSPNLDVETRRIWLLIGALSEAFWRRADDPNFPVLEMLVRNSTDYRPESEIWNELTRPENFVPLARYVQQVGLSVNEYAGNLHSCLFAASKRRRENEGFPPSLSFPGPLEGPTS